MPAASCILAQRVALSLALCLVLALGPAHAQTDSIQINNGTINAPGRVSLTSHGNFTPNGRTVPSFPGGIVPNHAWNGTLEWAYGVNEWMEIGTSVPLYSITNRQFLFDGAKVRSTFVVPNAAEQMIVYGIQFEFSANTPRWRPNRFGGEIRPILGLHLGPIELILNPALDTDFVQPGRLDFAPATRIAYNASVNWAFGIEHYADYGALSRLQSGPGQQQTIFGVVDYKKALLELEFGIGIGLTKASDALVLKLIVTYTF